jgi:hypothetical protein
MTLYGSGSGQARTGHCPDGLRANRTNVAAFRARRRDR